MPLYKANGSPYRQQFTPEIMLERPPQSEIIAGQSRVRQRLYFGYNFLNDDKIGTLIETSDRFDWLCKKGPHVIALPDGETCVVRVDIQGEICYHGPYEVTWIDIPNLRH